MQNNNYYLALRVLIPARSQRHDDIAELSRGVGPSAGTCVFGGAEERFRRLQKGLQTGQKRLCRKAILRHHPRAARIGHGIGVALLLLIGMVAFVTTFPAAPPEGFFDPASALPVQVYNWTQRADPVFFERASGAIIVLLIFLLCMNLLAIYLRRKFERRW